MRSDSPLSRKAVVVTGAGRGLGAAYARVCASLGAAVYAVDMDEESAARVAAEIVTQGGTAAAAAADVTDAAAMVDAAEECAARFGGLTGWVNNAGLQDIAPIAEIRPAVARRVVEVNVLGVLFGTRAAAITMLKQGAGGSIVNITSGAHLGMRAMSVYGGSKGAVASLTYSAALDLAEHGIRVNALSPVGASEMSRESDEYWERRGKLPMSSELPLPENNAAAVAYLLSDQAEGVTGQVIRVDGEGVSLLQHPVPISASLVPGSNWTFETMADAFAGRLRRHLVAVGLKAPTAR